MMLQNLDAVYNEKIAKNGVLVLSSSCNVTIDVKKTFFYVFL